MPKKIVSLCLFLFLLASFSAAGVYAQQTAAAAASEITAEKKALIAQLLEIVKAKESMENSIDMILGQMERDYPQMISQLIARDTSLSEEKKKEMKKKIVASAMRFSKRYRELYPQRLNLQQVIDQIFYPLYDKYFTDAEIKELVNFYKSPVGEKSIKVMPQLMRETMQRAGELLNPKIMLMVDEIVMEEKLRLAQEEKPQPGAK